MLVICHNGPNIGAVRSGRAVNLRLKCPEFESLLHLISFFASCEFSSHNHGGPRFESFFFCLFMDVCKGFGRIYH